MTEEKWCCQPTASESGKCIGSACMAWRTHPTMREIKLEPDEQPPSNAWEPHGTMGRADAPPMNTGGFCGLAGAPR